MYSDILHLSDAKLRTDDGCTFEIHKAILAVNSNYFRALFCGTDKDRSEFTIPGMSAECLSDILFYVYTGVVRVSERNVKDLMIAANYLLIKDLQTKIKQSIKDNMTKLNCLGILKAAHQISDEDIFKESFRFVQTRFENVLPCQTGELADLPLEILGSILSNRSLFVYNEATVWQAIVQWTQKDIQFRVCCVPPLLLTLAVEDVGEELALEILQHELISENSLVKYFKSSNDFTCNRDVFLSFVRSYSNPFTQLYSHRIPLNLHAICYYEEGSDNHYLYITYDENLDLWRKITQVTLGCPEFLIAIGHNIFIFDIIGSECKKFDLSSMDWVTMENFRNEYSDEYCVLAIDKFIYILGKIIVQNTYVAEVYDTANDRWFSGVPMPTICYGAFVANEEKIYLVGHDEILEEMVTWMFDPATEHWSIRSRPTINRTDFALVAYHRKIYLIGGSDEEGDFYFSDVEVFDPATNQWKDFPNLPYSSSCISTQVFNDQIIVYDETDDYEVERNNKRVRWNDAMKCWEKFDKTYQFDGLLFCSVDDVDTIKMITKQNRDPKTKMEKSFFI